MSSDKGRTGNPLWDSWLDTLKAAASPMSTYASLIEQLRAGPGGAGSSGTGAAAPVDLLQAFFSGQQAMLRMTELAAETMRSFGTPAGSAAAADGEGTFKRFLDDFREKLTTNPMLGGLDLWTAGAAAYQPIAQPWTELMGRSMSIAAAMGSPSGSGDPLGEALERSFGVLADFPGINGELPALLREAAANSLALANARETYRVIMAATWQRAFDEITREVLRRIADRTSVDTAAALLSLSTSVADRVFVETFNSERYIEAQQRLSAALADRNALEMKVVDLYARSGHFPTRRDHDEVLREISVLRREVHALKRSMRSTPAARTEPMNDTPASRNGGNPNAGVAAGATASPKRRVRAKPRENVDTAKKSEHGM